MHKLKQYIAVVVSVLSVGVYGVTFGTGSNAVELAFSDIGYVGNPDDTATPFNETPPEASDGRRFGAVNYSYRIGVTEVTVDQFFRAWTNDSRIGNGNENGWNNGVDHAVGSGAPASRVSWFEAAKFANWLTSGDAYAGAYQFDTNGVLTVVDRDAALVLYGTVYALASEDEWYKAAYYHPVNDGSYSLYSDGTDSTPLRGVTNGWNYSDHSDGTNEMWEAGVGGLEQNGTRDMNGNIWEWIESAWDQTLDDLSDGRVLRDGGAHDTSYNMKSTYRHSAFNPTNEHELVGFRVVAIPASQAWLNVAVAGAGSVGLTEGWQAFGTNLALVATPKADWLFMGWSGDLSGDYTTASTNLVMDGDKSITAIFSDDADGDGLTNSEESLLGTDPLDTDSDDDTMPDDWEVGAGLDPSADDAGLDADSDGLLNLEEYGLGTDPMDSDSDDDGLLDGDEINAHGTDPLDSDSDNDGLSDGAEIVTHGTNPLNGDTDGDTFDDGQEVDNGGSPLISDLWRIDHIRNNGSEYDLFSSNSVLDLTVGQAGFEVTNGTAWLSLQLEESTDLITWTNAGDEAIWSIPVDLSNAFYRVRSGH